MNILQLIHSLNLGGTEKVVYDLIQALLAEKVQVIPVCLNYKGILGEALEKEQIPVIVLNRHPGIDLKIIPKLWEIIKRYRIDIVHTHQYSTYFYGVMAAIPFPKVKTVFTEHGRFYPESRKWKRILANQGLTRLTNRIVAVSQFTKQSLEKYEAFPEGRIEVVYNGIRFEEFQIQNSAAQVRKELSIPEKSFVIGTVARLCKEKNLKLLLKGFKGTLTAFPTCHLVIVGDGELMDELRGLAHELQIEGKTHFLGFRTDVIDLLNSFDLFVLTSFTEGTSITLLEAMYLARPIIATAVGGNVEVIQDQENGVLIPSGGEKALITAINTLIMDAPLRERLGDKAKASVIQNFSFNKMVKAYQQIYTSLTGRK